jgi:tripartite-type tricarboxylate transporter receptor subunit TctC
MKRRDFLKSTSAVASATILAPFLTIRKAWAAYPSKPVTMLVPFAAGGGGDILTRVMADHARNKRSVPVAVEYRPGAGATIAPSQVARAEPDGSTLGLYSVSPFLTVPHLQKVSYETPKSFTFIATHAFIPIAFYVTTESQFADWKSVLKYAKDNPGKFRWGTSGVRGVAHIAVEAAFKKEGVQTTFVPFTGGAQAITAMLGGHIEAVVSADYGPHLSAGKVRLIVLTGTEKMASQPNLPTFKELAYPLATEAVYGLYGPAGLPTEVVSYWEGAIQEMMKTEEFAKVLTSINASPVFMNSQQFTASVLENYKGLGEAIEALGFKK